MAVHVKWTPDLSVGDAELDREHDEFIRRADAFIDGCSSGRGRQLLEPLAEFLTHYVEQHFSHEERLMREAAYPGLDGHLALHRYFRTEFEEIRAAIAQAPTPRSVTVLKTNTLLIDWFLKHIVTADRAFATFRFGNTKSDAR